MLIKNTTLKENCALKGELRVVNSAQIKAGTKLVDGTVLAKGTELSFEDASKLGLSPDPTKATYKLEEDITINKPGGITLEKDATVVEGSVLKANSEQEISTIISLEDDINAKSGTVLTAGTALKKGSSLEAGTILSGDDARTLGLTTDATLSEYTLTAEKVLATDTTFTGPIALGEGSVIKGGSELTPGSHIKAEAELAAGTILSKGTLNPLVHGKIEGHDMNYEVGTGNNINANTLGMDATFNTLMEMMQDIISTVDKSLEEGTQITSDDLHDLFNNKLGEIDEVMSDISTKTSDLGSRMARLDYVDNRLTDNYADYKELLSNTEDIDVEETYVEFNSRYAAYTAALQATSKVIMNTLADYL